MQHIKARKTTRLDLKASILIILAGCLGAVSSAYAQYPTRPIRIIVPFSRGGRTGSRRMGWCWGGDGARPPGLVALLTRIAGRIVCACALAIALPVVAQTYPTRPIRIIVPYAPGGNIDITARTIAPGMSSVLGQSVYVENRGGADGRIGTQAAAKASPDGYTWLLGANAALTITPVFAGNAGYDALRDFVPTSLVSIVPLVLETHPMVPAQTVGQLIALAKVKPENLSMGSQGSGSYLVGNLFQMAAGARFLHIRYKGSGPALVDLMGGQIDLMFDQLTSSLSLIRAGKLRALGVTTLRRSSLMPELRTVDESGLRGFEASTYTGVMLPAGTSRDIVQKVQDALGKVLDTPATAESFAKLGADVLKSTPEEFSRRLKADLEKWARVKKQTNIRLD